MAHTPWGALDAFVLTARLGNLSRAAEQLHLTVSALSHQIRALELRLERTLFVRSPRGLKPTADGERLLEQIGQPLETVRRAIEHFRMRPAQSLTLSVLPSIAASWLVVRLPDFLAQHPQLELSLESSTDLVDFQRSSADAALRFGLGQWPGLHTELLFEEWLTPVASPELHATLGRPTLEQLGELPLLGDPGERWPAWFQRHGGELPKRFAARFSDSETLHRAAVAGMGVALARMTMARSQLDSGRLIALFPQRMQAERSHYLVYPDRSLRQPGLLVFRDWLHTQAKRYRDALAADVVAR